VNAWPGRIRSGIGAVLLLIAAPCAALCLLSLAADVGSQRAFELSYTAPHGGWDDGDAITILRWLGEMACHFAPQASLGLLPALCWFRRRHVIAGTLLILMVAGCARAAIAAWDPRLPAVPAEATAITVAHGNVNKWNGQFNTMADRARAVDQVLELSLIHI
jgi:hypothetical protein